MKKFNLERCRFVVEAKLYVGCDWKIFERFSVDFDPNF